MERIEFGEECDYHLVSDILGQAISLWNQTVEKLREMLSEPETLLKQLQCCLSEDGPEDLANESHLDRFGGEGPAEALHRGVEKHCPELYETQFCTHVDMYISMVFHLSI